MPVWIAEIAQSWRASLRRPGFLVLAACVLALGIGASATAFTLIDQVLLRPLPVPQASRLVVAGRLLSGQVVQVNARQYARLDGLKGVRSLGALTWITPEINVAIDGVPDRAVVTYASRNLLPTLGVHPPLGRNFSVEEDRPGGAKVVILGNDFWKRRYHGDPGAIGRSMNVEGVPHTIIGVLPKRFDKVGSGGDIMLPAAISAHGGAGRAYMAVARLADGASASAVGAEVEARLHGLYADDASSPFSHARFGVKDYRDNLRVHSRSVLVLFQGCALLVLLIAWINLSGLMLLRALTRHHEIAVRDALGSSRFRLALPLLAEGLLVGLLGAVAGSGLAMAGMRILSHVIPPEVTGGALSLDARTLTLVTSVAVFAAMLSTAFGLRRSRRIVAMDELREGGRSGVGRYRGRFGSALVVVQVALAALLLCASGMFLRKIYTDAHAPLGFSGRHVLTAELAPVRADYPDVQAVHTLSRRLRERIRAIPGVTDATYATSLPMGSFFGRFGIRAKTGDGKSFVAFYHAVGADFFRVFNIAMRQGRRFNDGDTPGNEPVAIISQGLSRRLYHGQPIGKRILVDGKTYGTKPWYARIVGVVGDTGEHDASSQRPPDIYVPLAQMPDALLSRFRNRQSIHFALRVQGAPGQYRKALSEAVGEIDAEQPVAHMQSMEAVIDDARSGAATGLWMTGIFAALALLLAGAGLYAVMAVSVAARRHELGVRAAVGASPRSLARHVLQGGIAQVTVGLMLASVLAVPLPFLLRASMNQLGANNAMSPLTVIGVCVVLVAAGVLASLPPAVRAGRVPPLTALRGE